MPGKRDNKSKIIGYILLGLGIVYLFGIFLDLNLVESIFSLWPIILILIGWQIIKSGKRSRSQKNIVEEQDVLVSPDESGPEASSGNGFDRIEQSSIIGDTSVRMVTKNFQGGNASGILGDIHINLSEVDIQNKDKTLRISTVIGDTNLTLPQNFSFEISASSVIGEIKIFGQLAEGFFRNLSYKSKDFDSSDKRLRIIVSSVLGDIHIS